MSYLSFSRKNFVKPQSLLVPALIFLLISIAGCFRESAVKVELASDSAVELRPAEALEISIASNPTTGYTWDIADFEGSEVLAVAGEPRYMSDPQKDPGIVGSGGSQIFSFKALKKGEAKLVFEYTRPWEKNTAPARKYTVRVIVRSADYEKGNN